MVLRTIQILSSCLWLALCAGLLGCEPLGTKVNVLNPEALPKVQRVAIWPTLAVPVFDVDIDKQPDAVDLALKSDYFLFLDAAELSSLADSLLEQNLRASGTFEVIPADSVIRMIGKKYLGFSRFQHADWRDFRDLLGAETLVMTKFVFKDQQEGVNTYVTLQLLDRESQSPTLEVEFNTMWGKSYVFPQGVRTTLPDAIHGAVNGAVKELKKHRR